MGQPTCAGLAVLVAVLVAIEPCHSKFFEPHIPSFFSSNSGATKPQRARTVDPLASMVNPGGGKGKGGGRRGGPRDMSLSHVCGGAGKPWNPFVGEGRHSGRRRLQAAEGGGEERYGGLAGGWAQGGGSNATGTGRRRGAEEVVEAAAARGGGRRLLQQRRGQAGYNALVGPNGPSSAGTHGFDRHLLPRYSTSEQRIGRAEVIGWGDEDDRAKADSEVVLKARLKKYVAGTQEGAGAAGFNPLEKYCNMERRASGSVSEDEKLLIGCLRSGAKCSAAPERIARAANRLKGMQMLNIRPKCMFTNRKTCSTSMGNPETGLEFLSTSMKARADKVTGGGRTWAPPAQDLPWRHYGRCAVVGNGPSLQSSPNGGVIDRFDAVFRFNEIGGRDPLARHHRHMGHKTTFRVFARKPTFDMAEGALRIRPQSGESWLFWHAHSRLVLPAVERKVKGAQLYMFSPALVRWQLEVYFQLRRDMRRLGFGPWSCPRNINSGLHAILLGQHLCSEVGTFGISHLQRMAENGAHFGDSKHPMSRFHSWGFDTLAMRVLHLAERIRICG